MGDPEDELLADLDAEPSSIERAVAEASSWIGDGIEGVGEGRTDDGEPCVVVFVSTLDADTRRRIPSSVGDHPVVLSGTDPFRVEAAED